MSVINNSSNGYPFNIANINSGLGNGVVETVQFQLTSPSTGFSITLAEHLTILANGTLLASGTLTMPATPVNNQRQQVVSVGGVTALTVSPNSGQTIVGAPTSIRAGGSFEFIYHTATTQWLPYIANTPLKVTVNAGNPNTVVAGIQGDFVVDSTNNVAWYCSTSGIAASAVWTQLATNLSGTWTPVPSNLTVVGTPTYSGTYNKVGSIVFCTMSVVSTTSTTSTQGVTSFTGLPFGAATSQACIAINDVNGTNLGNGLVNAGATPVIFPPSWTTLSNVLISFTYAASIL